MDYYIGVILRLCWGIMEKKMEIIDLLPFFLGAWLAWRARILPPIGMAAPLRDAFADSQPNFAFTATLRILRIAQFNQSQLFQTTVSHH